jgi:hypothetical protein
MSEQGILAIATFFSLTSGTRIPDFTTATLSVSTAFNLSKLE